MSKNMAYNTGWLIVMKGDQKTKARLKHKNLVNILDPVNERRKIIDDKEN